MGGFLSYLLGSGGESKEPEPEGFDEPEPVTGLTPRQKRAVVETWALVQPHMKATGVELLVRLFEAHPQYKQLFSAFKDVPTSELSSNKKFAAHASSVMHAVASVVDSLDDTDCLVELLTKIGTNHKRHRVSPQAFTDLKAVLLKLLSDKLGEHLSPVAAEAWDKTLTVANAVLSQQLQGPIEEVKPSPVKVVIPTPTAPLKTPEPVKISEPPVKSPTPEPPVKISALPPVNSGPATVVKSPTPEPPEKTSAIPPANSGPVSPPTSAPKAPPKIPIEYESEEEEEEEEEEDE